jgi:tetratricopeptide (TPR) repeat protein
MDRVALDISKYWEHRALELALSPGEHAALVGERDASAPGASAEVLERAVNGFHHLGDLHQKMGNSTEALEMFENALVVSERLSNQNPANAALQNLLCKYKIANGL